MARDQPCVGKPAGCGPTMVREASMIGIMTLIFVVGGRELGWDRLCLCHRKN